MALLKITVCLMLVAVCLGDEFTKCKPSKMHIDAMKGCLKSELNKDINSKEEMKEWHKAASEDDMKKVMVCTMKKKGVLNANNEYVEAKALECAEEMEAEPAIKAKIIEGIKTCGKDLDNKSKEDQMKIFKCTKDLIKKECM